MAANFKSLFRSVTIGFCLTFLTFTAFGVSINFGSVDSDTLINNWKVFPAPTNFQHKTILTFTLVNPAKVSIKIFDLDGREVAYLLERNVPAGNFELLLETKHLKKGMYYCNFFTGGKMSMKKMIMVN